jgi:hypothetical protein
MDAGGWGLFTSSHNRPLEHFRALTPSVIYKVLATSGNGLQDTSFLPGRIFSFLLSFLPLFLFLFVKLELEFELRASHMQKWHSIA